MSRLSPPVGYQWVAVRELVAVVPDEGIKTVRLKLGQPVALVGSDFGCWVHWEGLDDNPRCVFGIDSWQALTLAIGLLRAEAEIEIRDGVTFHNPGSADAVSLDDVFWRIRRHDEDAR